MFRNHEVLSSVNKVKSDKILEVKALSYKECKEALDFDTGTSSDLSTPREFRSGSVGSRSVGSLSWGRNERSDSLYFKSEGALFDRLAVQIENGEFSFGRGKKKQQALKGVTLSVPEGAIYGLLGPSGCGKTTLLNTITGKYRLKSGEVWAFGEKPGSKNGIIPGRGVGFMPQELALFPEFTIENTLTYFGRIHQIDSRTLKERSTFLIKFLDLPDKSKLVQNLSGGQKRRVSLAAALIHEPPLLILDEPTVGVDPLLRKNIWNHLIQLTSKEGMTVIITTHYIEEARQADVIGLMRKGRLLAQAAPDDLLSYYQTDSLEDCFLKLCKMDKENKGLLDKINMINSPPKKTSLLQRSISTTSYTALQFENESKNIYVISESTETESHQRSSLPKTESRLDLLQRRQSVSERKRFQIPGKPNRWSDGFSKVSNLMLKNCIRLRRNPLLLLFQFILPVFQVALVYFCLGRSPDNLPIAVVNHEIPKRLSQRYLNQLDNAVIIQNPFADLESALNSVRRGENWCALHIGENFTRQLFRRYREGLDATEDTITGSIIKVYMDMTNQQIGLVLQKTFLEGFRDFTLEVLEDLGANPNLASLPIVFEKPIYGDLQSSNFTEFITIGNLLAVVYLLSLGLTALSLVDERRSGIFDRNWVQGVTSFQIMLSHLLTQSLVLFVQVFILLFFIIGVFNISNQGSYVWVVVITFLQGISGLALGMLISAISRDEQTAIMLGLGIFFPGLVVGGAFWPVQAQPYYIRYISEVLPQALPTESLRNIISKGWGIEQISVWLGIVIVAAWTVIYLLAAAVIFRFKKFNN